MFIFDNLLYVFINFLLHDRFPKKLNALGWDYPIEVHSQVANGMKRRDMRMDAPDAIAEFQALKEDPLASWSLLGDENFLARMLTVLFLAFFPCALLTSKVYPISDEMGQLLPNNIMADVAFGFSAAAFFLIAVLLRIGYRQVEVNQLLRQRTIFMETGGGGYFVQKKSTSNQRSLSKFAWQSFHTLLTKPKRRIILAAVLCSASVSICKRDCAWRVGLGHGDLAFPLKCLARLQITW